MHCALCLHPDTRPLHFNCASCARHILHDSRVQIARTLLHTESLGREVERFLSASPASASGSAPCSPASPSTSTKHSPDAPDAPCSAPCSAEIRRHVAAIRKETEQKKREVARKKKRLERRGAELKAAREALSRQREEKEEKKEEKGVTEGLWDGMHAKTMESRGFLCREAAQLYGLQQQQQQRRRKSRGPGRDVYLIGGIPIADLRDLNNASPAQVTTSTGNLAHLIHLVSHYLSVRLPAEITLSHRDYPLPTISPPISSYISRDVPFPGSTPSHSSNNSPSASRTADQRSLPRPHPLHLDRKLSTLAREDPVAYASFVEGITYLAWDIAWVCKTQGLNIGANSWEEVCAMGKNLWQLLIAPPPSHQGSGPTWMPWTPSRPAVPHAPTSAVPNVSQDSKLPSAMLGHFSHGTAHSFLAAAAGTEYMRGWRLQSAVKVVEKVKAMLLSERTGAEWEILEGNEWEEEAPAATAAGAAGAGGGGEIGHAGARDQGVVTDGNHIQVKEGSGGGEGGDDGMGNAVAASATGTATGDEDGGKGKGSSGWMKVKSRGAI